MIGGVSGGGILDNQHGVEFLQIEVLNFKHWVAAKTENFRSFLKI